MSKLSTAEKKQLANWFRMSKFINTTNQKSNEFLKPYGVSIAQFDTLNQISLHQPLTQQELGRYLMVSKGGISQMIMRLEKSGWLYREQKWKEKYLNLTPQGTKLVENLRDLQGANQAKMLSSLSDEENDVLNRLLTKLNQGIE